MRSAKALNLIPSGIEPVDKLLGGLESGHTYLAHGDASGKSLFGIKFLIEGLKRGEKAALVIRTSHEDAVRRFARLGYDCLNDLHEGKLIILESSDDLLSPFRQLPKLASGRRELERALRASRPGRITFDPVTDLPADDKDDLEREVREFTRWAASFAATVLLVANDAGQRSLVVKRLAAVVNESFRFDVAESEEQATRMLVFEKSPAIPRQPIEVDPTRGIFLLERSSSPVCRPAPKGPSAMAPAGDEGGAGAIRENVDAVRWQDAARFSAERPDVREAREPGRDHFTGDEYILELDDVGLGGPLLPPVPASPRTDTAASAPAADFAVIADLNDFLDGVDAAITAIQLPPLPAADLYGIADRDITRRATDTATRAESAVNWQHSASLSVTTGEQGINPKDFTIVIIDEEALSRQQIVRALGPYRLEVVEEIVTGIARIMSSNPDLVILDIDMPIVDGFKLLAQLRACLSAPIIMLSKSHVRAGDRVYALELGADYFLTKPFSQQELKQKARQLIARYRGIDSWIRIPTGIARKIETAARPAAVGEIVNFYPERRANFNRALSRSKADQLEPYERFIEQVEENVRMAVEKSQPFSIVGCCLEASAKNADREAVQVFKCVSPLLRKSDLISINPQNDLVVLLHETSTKGARAFIRRLRERVSAGLHQDLTVWTRSFPTLEEGKESHNAGA